MQKNYLVDKKQKELDVLKKIFPNAQIKNFESPDFIIENTIGVEITSFYHSQVSAILHNSKTFFEEGRKARKYKKDEYNKEISSWVTIKVHDEKTDFVSKTLPMPFIRNHPERIKQIIIGKNKIKYQSNLEKLYLIIEDKEDLFFFQDTQEQFPQIILRNSCQEVLESKFDKIFFISPSLPDYEYFEIKKSIFYTLCRVFEKYYLNYFKIKDLNWYAIILNFKNYCSYYGLKNFKFSHNNNLIIFKDYSYKLFNSFNIDYINKDVENILITQEFIEYAYKNCRNLKNIDNFR